MELNEIAIVNASLVPWDERGVKGAIVNQEEVDTSFCKSKRYSNWRLLLQSTVTARGAAGFARNVGGMGAT